MTEATTRGIRVRVRAEFVPERSAPDRKHFFFSYRVRIENLGEEAAQLVSRRWEITDGEGNVQVVEGAGVVGEQPLLTPGASFEYTSFCPLPTPYAGRHLGPGRWHAPPALPRCAGAGCTSPPDRSGRALPP